MSKWRHCSGTGIRGRAGRTQAGFKHQCVSLNNLLQKGMLKGTLQAHPDKFQIRDIAGNPKQWEFLLLE